MNAFVLFSLPLLLSQYIYIYIFHPRIYHALRTRTLWRNFSTLKLNLQRKISISSHCLEHALSFTPRSFVNRKNQIYPPQFRIFFFFCNWSRLRRRAIVLVSPPLVKKNLSTRDRIQDRHVLVSKVKFSFFWDREIRSDKKFVEGRCYAPLFFFFFVVTSQVSFLHVPKMLMLS